MDGLRRQPVTLRLVETSTSFRGVRVVGGDLALDLLNTRTGPKEGDPDGDVLERYEDLVAWAQHLGIIAAREAEDLRRRAARQPAEAAAAFERALETRDALDRLFRAVAHADAPREADLARLAGDEAQALSRARLVPAGDGYGWSWDGGEGLERPLWPVVHAAVATADRGPARPRQGVRLVSLPVRRREPQPQPPLVLDGRLRHAGQDARVRRATAGGPCIADVRLGLVPARRRASRPRRGRRAPRARGGGRSRSRAGRACRGCS